MLRFCFLSAVIFVTANTAFCKEEIPPNIVAGKQVDNDAKITVGTKLVGIWDKKNYLVEVIELKRDKQIRIHWIGFDKSEDVDVLPNTLYYVADTTQTRKARTSPLPKEYQAFDKNGDGQIGLYEWDRAKYAEFKRLDKNHDGFLTPQELAVKVSATATTVASTDPKEMKEATPNPGNLEAYNGMIGQSVTFAVTGKTEGQVIGTDTYTTSSDLAAAAVHAGRVKAGEMGTVTATFVESPKSYKGSVANGVTSVDGPEFTAAFTLK
jgi:LCCL domain/EF hand